MPWVKHGINRYMPSVIWQPEPPIPVTLAELPRDAVILDVGAGGRVLAPSAIGVDFLPFRNTRVVSDIHRLGFADASVDAIFCTGTLEHVPEPSRALREIHRILKPGGIVHLEVPFMQPYHADPDDFWRWTLPGIKLYARQHGFSEIRSGSHLRSISAMNGIVISFWQSWVSNRYLRKGIELALTLLIWPLKYLDGLAGDRTSDVPSAVYFVGRKVEASQDHGLSHETARAASPSNGRIALARERLG